MVGYIYKTTNLINGKIYIGQHRVNNDVIDKNYFGSGKLLLEAIKKYGKENFKCEIIEWCESEKSLSEKEVYYIDYYKSKVTFGNYNMSDGGYVPRLCGELNGNYGKHRPHTEDERKHLSEITKGHKPTFTRKHTAEECLKMSAAGKQREHNLLYKDYKHVSDLSKGKKFMTNGIDQKWIMKDDISYYLEAGWTFGSCRKRNRNPNTMPWNKGIKRLEKSGTFNKIAVNNGTINKFISKEDLNEYINKGYSLGLKKFND